MSPSSSTIKIRFGLSILITADCPILSEVYTTATGGVITFYLTLREVLGNKSGEYSVHRIVSWQESL
ncbi:hypothetical protein SMATCC274_14010 [Serratia marcescens]|nr:hypothetical protein SMATCC274_14010 [Serratia marcescens]